MAPPMVKRKAAPEDPNGKMPPDAIATPPGGPPPEAGSPPPGNYPPGDEMGEVDENGNPIDEMEVAPEAAGEVPPPSGPPEKYGAQFLRRIHEDHSALIQDYHEALNTLDNPQVRAFIEKILQTQDEILTMTEDIFHQAYPDSQPINGAMGPDEGIPPDAMMGPEGMEDPMGDPMGDPGNDMPEGTMERMPADGTDERDEPTPEEALEGMDKMRKGKSFKGRKVQSRQKSLKQGLSNWKKHLRMKWLGASPYRKAQDIAGKKPDAKEPPAKPKQGGPSAGVVSSDDGDLAETTNAENPQSLLSGPLQEPERAVATKAAEFLKELSGLFGLEDEHRMKAYHHHQVLVPIAGLQEGKKAMGQPMATATSPALSSSQMSPAPSVGGDTGVKGDLHPMRKNCGAASAFLKDMAFERAFGEAHRQEALHHATTLEQAAQEEAMQEDKEIAEKERGVPGSMETRDVGARIEPGEVDTKRLKGVVAAQDAQIAELQKALERMNSLL